MLFAAVARGIVTGNMDYITHILITLCSFVCIETCVTVQMPVATYKKISVFFLLTTLILHAAYYIGPLKGSYFKATDSIALNFSNPNAAGLWLACLFILNFQSSFLYKGIKRIIFIGTALAILPIIMATKSRNSLFACVFFLVILICSKLFKIKKIPNWILFILSCLPIIVFFFYMFVIIENKDFWNELFSISSINKDINARESIWRYVTDDFWHCFLIGDYKKYYNEQMHNSLMTIYCRFGAIVTALVCGITYKTLKNLQEQYSFTAALSLSAILFTGCFEASVFIGIAGLYLMLLLVPACSIAEGANEYNYYSNVEPMNSRLI